MVHALGSAAAAAARPPEPLWKRRRATGVTDIYKSVPNFTDKTLIWIATINRDPIIYI